MNILFKGFNYSQDGPGNRLVYHLQGCNLRCPWCSNPESMAENGTLLVKGLLQDFWCPYGAIQRGVLNRVPCANCEDRPCLLKSGGALVFSCFSMTVTEVLDEAKRSTGLFFDGGGVTFTGGEPTVQFAELKECLAGFKALGIHTAIETNGIHPQLSDLFSLTDYLIFDCKHYDSVKHKHFTGEGNETVLSNIRAAATSRSQLLIRIPLVEGFNTTEQDAKNFAETFRSLSAHGAAFELLRYHEYGKDKWTQCGYDYSVRNAFVDDKRFSTFRDVFINNGLTLIQT